MPSFGALVPDLHLGLPDVGVIAGMFAAGYGIAHMPGGMLAEACGMRFAMFFGIAVETMGTVMSAIGVVIPARSTRLSSTMDIRLHG